MCLTLLNGTERMRAEKDLFVYKVLSFNIFDGNYVTPYMCSPIKFNKRGTFRQRIAKKDLVRRAGSYGLEVDYGIHSFTSRKRAEYISSLRASNLFFPAVIPAGSDYYIGDSLDAVSSELIVFEHYKSYEEYRSKHDVNETFSER